MESEPKSRKRGTRFVPLEDVPGPGLSQRSREVVALALCGAALYAMLCLATFRLAELDAPVPTGGMQNLGGAVGYYLAHGFARTLGLAGWIPWLLLLGGAMALFLGRCVNRLVIKVLGAVVFSAMLAILFAGADGRAGVREITPWGAGGVFGAFLSPRLEAAFGGTGRLLLVGFGSLVSFLLATEWMFSQLLLRAVAALEVLWRRLRREPQALAAGADVGGDVAALLDEPEEAAPRRSRRSRRKDLQAAVPDADAAVGDGDEDDEAGAEDEDAGAPPRRRRRRGKAAAEAADAD
ncbi:MAG: DNA translocase FtsK 4TM domain-containing protein, partial [Planctomycetes bacterium]|nr:DNA translocase FtsK 4TM domain-containing protein [Planctomycetota bacterium]